MEQERNAYPAQKKARLLKGGMLLIWSAVCMVCGGMLAGILPAAPSEPAEGGSAASPYTLQLARTLEEAMWKYDSITVDFEEGVMAITPAGGAAQTAALGDGSIPSGTLYVEKYLAGAPQPGARFAIYRESGELCANLTTDGYGKTQVILGTGSYSISEMATDADALPVEEYPFIITQGEDLTLMLSSAKMGRVQVSAAPGEEIRLYPGVNRNRAPLYQGAADDSGSLTIPSLAPGEYTLYRGEESKRIVLYSGETLHVQFGTP